MTLNRKRLLNYVKKGYVSSVHTLIRLDGIIQLIKIIEKQIDALNKSIPGERRDISNDKRTYGGMVGSLISSSKKGQDSKKDSTLKGYKEELEKREKFIFDKFKHFHLFIRALYLSGIYDIFEFVAEDLSEDLNEKIMETFLQLNNAIVKKFETKYSEFSKKENSFVFPEKKNGKEKEVLLEEAISKISSKTDLVASFHISADKYVKSCKKIKKYSKNIKKLVESRKKVNSFGPREKINIFDFLLKESRRAYFTGAVNGISMLEAIKNIESHDPAHVVAFSLEDEKIKFKGERYESLWDLENKAKSKFEMAKLWDIEHFLERLNERAAEKYPDLEIEWPEKPKLI